VLIVDAVQQRLVEAFVPNPLEIIQLPITIHTPKRNIDIAII
jgi:hypothetical protein